MEALCLVGDYTKLAIKMMKQVCDLTDGEFVVIENSFDPSTSISSTIKDLNPCMIKNSC